MSYMSSAWLRIAVVYFVIGVCFGMYTGISQKFEFATVHAHINLLGWVSLALAGIIYHLFPKAAKSTLGKVHFWLHNIGLPIFVIGLFLEVADVFTNPVLISVGGTVAIVGIIVFAVNVFRQVRPSL